MTVQGILIVSLTDETCVHKEFKISVYNAIEITSS
jgi:hypothetical protein